MTYKIHQDRNGFYAKFKLDNGIFWRTWCFQDIADNRIIAETSIQYFETENRAKNEFLKACAEYKREEIERAKRIQYNKKAKENTVTTEELAKYLTQRTLKEKYKHRAHEQ